MVTNDLEISVKENIGTGFIWILDLKKTKQPGLQHVTHLS